MPRRATLSLGMAALVAGLALSGCAAEQPTEPATETPASATSAPDVTGSLAHLVPEALRDTTIVVGFLADEQLPHVVRADDGSWSGPLTEVVAAAVDRLGLTTTEAVITSDQIEQLESGEVTILVSGTTPSEHIYEVADGVSYIHEDAVFLAGAGVELGSDPAEAGLDDLCGLSIGFTDTNTDSANRLRGYLAEAAALCAARDLEALEPVPFEVGAGTLVDAVVNGDVDAVPTGEVYGAYLRAEHPDLTVAGPVREQSVQVFLASKDSALAEPLAAAVEALVADGTYAAIMDGYGLLSRPPSPAEVNPLEE